MHNGSYHLNYRKNGHLIIQNHPDRQKFPLNHIFCILKSYRNDYHLNFRINLEYFQQ